MTCPFCKSTAVMPVVNSKGSHWLFCTECKASGPHHSNAEDAKAAFNKPPGLIARIMGKKNG